MSILRGKATGGQAGLANAGEVRRALALLGDAEYSVELRGLPSGRSRVRAATDLDGLVKAAEELADDKGVYYCLNPVTIPPGEDRAAKVADVARRRLVLIDVDPVRPPDTNATNSEVAVARFVAEKIDAWLKEQGLPGPVWVASGNGWHLLLLTTLPNNDESRVLVKNVLSALADRFDTDLAKVDRKVFNASRISKLPGTWARKGPHSAERPHRPARLVRVPEELEEYTAAQLEVLAGSGPSLLENDPDNPDNPEKSPVDKSSTPPFQDCRDKQDDSLRGNGASALVGKASDGASSRERAYSLSALQDEVYKLSRATVQTRNNTLNTCCFKLATLIGEGRLTEQEVVDGMLQGAKSCGLPEGETMRTIRSALEAGRSQPRPPLPPDSRPHAGAQAAGRAPDAPPPAWEPYTPLVELPPAPEFPLAVFPQSLRSFASQVAWSLNCPTDFAAVPMLAVAGGAVANSRRLSITRTHRPTAALWCCVIGDPGSGKTPALGMVAEPFWACQKERMARWKEEKRKHKEAPEAEKDPGPPSRIVVDDFTVESLVSVLADNPRGALCVKDELAALVTGMNQYKAGGQGNDRQNVLKLWSGETIISDRKSNPDGAPVVVSRPFLSLAGGTQPDVVPSLRGQGGKGKPAPNDGMLDRFLVSYPPPVPALPEEWREVSEEAAGEWDRVVRRLLSLPMAGAPGDQWPALVPLTPCGRDAWQSFTAGHARELNDPEFPDFLKGPWAKFKGYAGRIALVLHCLRDACGEAVQHGVDGDSMARAASLVSYFKAHARKALAAMEADPVVPLARRVLAWVRREKPACFKRHQLFSDVKSRAHFPSLDALERPLERLCRHGYLRASAGSRETGGRPETTTYETHPQLLTEPSC